jgi:two-component system cell cycle sensor histidine kinase/response regulator CckA
VLLNLGRNASESLTAPGVVEVSLDTIDTADPTDEFVRGPCAVITVRDTGRGMEPETLDRIFEPFFTTKSGRQGHGLGLATAFGLVRQHDGTIRVASELGLGSRFEVHLPLAKVE